MLQWLVQDLQKSQEAMIMQWYFPKIPGRCQCFEKEETHTTKNYLGEHAGVTSLLLFYFLKTELMC